MGTDKSQSARTSRRGRHLDAPPSSLDGHVWQSHDGHHHNPMPEKAQRVAASAGTGLEMAFSDGAAPDVTRQAH